MKMLLNGKDWTLTGWNRHQWKFYKVYETGGVSRPVVAPIQAQVPGAVQQDLLHAGLIEDWNKDQNFFHMEWVEHREWVYEKTFSLTEQQTACRCWIHFEGLDFAGHVIVNEKEVFSFEGMHCPYEAELTDFVNVGVNTLRVVFLQPPEIDGQVGYTSRTTVLKSRYNYGWDWMPRMVNIGIYGDVWLQFAEHVKIERVDFESHVQDERGVVTLMLRLYELTGETATIKYAISDADEVCAQGEIPLHLQTERKREIKRNVTLSQVRRWYPAGMGNQALYTLHIWIEEDSVFPPEEWNVQIGFCELSYERPEGATEYHLPYAIYANNEWMPIKGLNWVPQSPFYGTVTEEDYRYYLGQLRLMGINLLRVWGGALQESETFYRLCDEMGFLVWQEFPQSSSNIDNDPCKDPLFIQNLTDVASCYIYRRRYHVCLAIWCGGNELYDATYCPRGLTDSNLAALAQVVKTLDSERLFLPASPSGPVAAWKPGLAPGMCGDTHGPWTYEGPQQHYFRFNHDTSLLHSEVGAAACPRLETLLKYTSRPIWPFDETNPYWLDRGAWWIYDKELVALFGRFDSEEQGLEDFVRAYRYTQMEALRYAATAVRRAGKRKAGIIIWMANEPFPNSANTSILEYDGCPRPAYYKLQTAFAQASLGLSYDSVVLRSGEKTKVQLYAFSDRKTVLNAVTAEIYDADGKLLEHLDYHDVTVEYTAELGDIVLPVVAPFVLVRLTAAGNVSLCEEYVFSVDADTPLGPLLKVPCKPVQMQRIDENRFQLTNPGKTVVLFAECIGKNAAGNPLVVQGSYRCILPGESMEVYTNEPCVSLEVVPLNHTMGDGNLYIEKTSPEMEAIRT